MKNNLRATALGFALVASLVVFSHPVYAKSKTAVIATRAPAVASEETNKHDIARIEEYLNNITTLQADFSQTNDNGEYRHGKMELRHPGKMHVAYDSPSKDFIVADGHFLNIWDGEMQQQTSVPIDSSLGDLLLRDNIKLSGDITVLKIERGAAKIEITVTSTKDPAAGQLTFIMEDKPLKLRAWRVLDPQGRLTTVSLENAREHVELPDGLFTFIPPNFGKNTKH